MKMNKLSRNTLKYIAMITMLIDHIGIMVTNTTLNIIMRYIIGRIAFLLFLFLFIDGFLRTKHYIRHLVDLLLFAIISEPFYDKYNYNKWLEFDDQNIMFTLFLNFMLLILLKKLLDSKIDLLTKIGLILVSITAISFLCYWCNFNYGIVGIVSCGIGYLLYQKSQNKLLTMSFISLCFCVEWLFGYLFDNNTAISAWQIIGWILPIFIVYFYDKDKPCKYSKIRKYSFYAFYPLHLCVLLIFKRIFLW